MFSTQRTRAVALLAAMATLTALTYVVHVDHQGWVLCGALSK